MHREFAYLPSSLKELGRSAKRNAALPARAEPAAIRQAFLINTVAAYPYYGFMSPFGKPASMLKFAANPRVGTRLAVRLRRAAVSGFGG
jgi:hypothetical protein